jgi:hypothetical protein
MLAGQDLQELAMPSHPSRAARRLARLAAGMVLILLAAGAAVATPAAAAVSPKPTSLTVSARTDPGVLTRLSGVPAASMPSVLAAAGTAFEVEVSLWNGVTPAAYPTPTSIVLLAPGPGALAVTEGVIPAGASTATISTSYSAPTAALVLTARTANKKSVLTATADAFPVDVALTLLGGASQALRDGTAGADGEGCATVDASRPMCGLLSLPAGATGDVALSLGICPDEDACRAGGLVTQFLADMDGLYTKSDPARMTIVCDRSLCGQGGVPAYRAQWSQAATGALVTAPACPAKGVIGPDQEFCTDTVASTRDNAGDLRLVVLFLRDVRGTIK